MSRTRDNWERLMAAVIRKQQLWQLFHEQSRSPSICSEASSSTSSSFSDLDLSESSSAYCQQLQDAVTKSQKLLPKLAITPGFSPPPFDVQKAFFDSVELLGRGNFGSVYVAVMDNGVRIVVKRLNSVSLNEPEFKRHMDMIGNVVHENVVPLRAYYSSTYEKLMFYDYHMNGSVYALLHGQTGENLAHVDWETRLKIVIGAARGLAEIHSRNGGKLVHGNIKSSNIFLNLQNYGCVSDLGLTNMTETTFMPTAWCYAPEVKSTQNVSQESDVYSFGILLLEILTRKSPVQVPGGPEAVNLVKLVSSIKSKVRTSRVFDADLLKLPTIREQMVKVLQIGISCIAKSVKKRPKMSDVASMLENLGIVPLEGKLVFVHDRNLTFEPEDVLMASADVIGEGTFGTSYKAELKNGDSAVVVKRLEKVNVSFEEFQQHMEVIGRIRHENVGKLKAYFFSEDVKLLLYDYHDQQSVSALLHVSRGPDSKILDWEARLQIALGAARGIAYIHSQDGGKLVHGNIKSSNIFLNEQQYGVVCDVGVAKVTKPVRQLDMPTSVYLIPERMDTMEVSQASDVYSFGVVLLELVTGLQSQYTNDEGELTSLVERVRYDILDGWPVEGFLDYWLPGTEPNMGAMKQVLRIGLDCAWSVPQSRPTISEVVKRLEEVIGVDA